ncbi:MAG: hypothetical protein ABIH23_04645 [bacterium]
MDEHALLKILRNLRIGTPIAGAIVGNVYTFGGVREYSGKGRYPHLKGQMVAVLKSDNWKRPEVLLFLGPLLIFVNAADEELGYGKMPAAYFDRYRLGKIFEMPNRHEYVTHYKALARYIKRMTN